MQKYKESSKKTEPEITEELPKPDSNLLEKTDDLLEEIDELLKEDYKEMLQTWASNQSRISGCNTCACGLFATCRYA